MIDESKIKKAANLHLKGIEDNLQDSLADACMPHDEINDIEDFITDAFYVGAQWAQQEFIKNLWHDASEEPQIKRHIIALSKVGMFIYDFNFKKGDKWSLYFDIYKIIRWAYLSDILPKEGGEK